MAEDGTEIPFAQGEPQIEDQEALDAWLDAQPHEVSIGVGVRAALRVFPLVAIELNPRNIEPTDKEEIRDIFSAFEALATSWNAGISFKRKLNPERKPNIEASSAVFNAVFSEKGYNKFFSDPGISEVPLNFLDAITSAAFQSSAAARAIFEPNPYVNFESSDDKDLNKSRKNSIFDRMRLDIQELKSRETPIGNSGIKENEILVEVLLRSLWDKNTPDWFLLNWKKLKRYLLSNGDHWEVWLDWFERRVQGGTRGTAIERLFVEVPYQMRNAEPAEINAEIARRIREVEAAEPPNDTSEAQTTHYDIGDTESWPEVLKSIVSVVDYGWNDNHQIAVIAGQANLAMLNRPSRKHDHDSQRAACDKLAENLIRQLATGRYNARSEYAEALTHYRQELPDGVGSGNIHLADAQARILRDMFAAEADILNLGLATALKAFLEHHIGFRTFYAEVPAFYENVRTGVLNDPLPLDAVDNIVDIVRENTPTMFADSVAPSIAEVKDGPVAPTIAVELDPDDIRTSAQGEYPKPPADPLGEINAEMARDKATAGAVKGLWEAFLRGEKVSKNLTGWKKVYDSLAPNITDIFNSLIGNGPPPSP